MTSAPDITATVLEGLEPGIWKIDPSHSEVGFTVRHLMSKVRGQFREFEGELVIAQNPLDSTATATIDLSSVDTRNDDRDNHLRSADFFSVDEDAQMSFTTTGIRQTGDQFVATGDLTIHGATKGVELNLDFLGVGGDPWGGTRVGFEGTTTISRKEWGINFNIPMDGDKVMIGDKVTIVLAVEAVLQHDNA
ncbi:MAG: YceI family protein [Nocardioidaceae bacterium]